MPQGETDAAFLRLEGALQPAIEHAVDLVNRVPPGGVVREGTSDHRAQFLPVSPRRRGEKIVRRKRAAEGSKVV
jgi:hypothetical protein